MSGTRTPPLYLAGVVAAVLASGAMMALGGGRPFLALVPAAGVVLGFGLWRLPIRWTASAVIFLAILLEAPSEHPMQGHWSTPLQSLGRFFFENLNTSLGISALHVSGLEVLLVLLLGFFVLRRLRGEEARFPGGTRPVFAFVGLLLGAVVLLELWGIARGGNVRQSLWQLRQLFWLGPLIILAMVAFAGDGGRRRLVTLVILAALLRSALGIWFYHGVAVPQGLTVAYVTTHSDSVLFVVAFLLAVQLLLEAPSGRSLALAALVIPVVGWALVLNDRRLAFVTLAISLIALPLVLRPALRRAAARALLVLGPVMILYAVVGWRSEAALFHPVAAVRSVTEEDDASNRSRAVENYNLIFSAWDSPLIGRGFGHEYRELEQGDDISRIFEQYRYLPHNGVLWLFMAGGLLGFLMIWMILPLGVFLAVRANLRGRTPIQHVVAVGAVFAVIAYSAQAFGDIGMQGWRPTLVLASFLGAAGTLAAATGAWRSEVRMVGFVRRARGAAMAGGQG